METMICAQEKRINHLETKAVLLHPKAWLTRTIFLLVHDLTQKNHDTNDQDLAERIGIERKSIEQVTRKLIRRLLLQSQKKDGYIHRIIPADAELYIEELVTGAYGHYVRLKDKTNEKTENENSALLEKLSFQQRKNFYAVFRNEDASDATSENAILSYLIAQKTKRSRWMLSFILSCNEKGVKPSSSYIAFNMGYKRSREIESNIKGLMSHGLLTKDIALGEGPRNQNVCVYDIPKEMIVYAEATRSGVFGALI